MKKIILPIYVLFIFVISETGLAQGQIWGLTTKGGVNNIGVIFKANGDGTEYSVQKDLISESPGAVPYTGELVQTTNGKLYGMTSVGGSKNNGVIFEFDPANKVYTKKHDFYGINGSFPTGNLIQASNGKLYGMTANGGINDTGVIFEYDPTNGNYNKSFDFSDSNGSFPIGGLIQASDGKLYGMTSSGGSYFAGVLFEFNLLTETYTKKVEFGNSTSGFFPSGNLLEASNGKLYGLVESGGTLGFGVLFEYDPNDGSFTEKIYFGANEYANLGYYPQGTLIETTNGKLYGLCNNGGVNNKGVIFEYDINTYNYVKKFDFGPDAETGYYMRSALTKAPNGNLYGYTDKGGVNDSGVIFEFNPTTQNFIKKFDFNTSDGTNPHLGSMIVASDGKLYGMTFKGGTYNSGVLFQYDYVSGVYVKDFEFASALNGEGPMGCFTAASNGKFYGTTSGGGINNQGILYEYDPTNGNYQKKHDFASATTGANPIGSLVQAPNGKLYGMTKEGGSQLKYGILYEFDPASGDIQKKIDFYLEFGVGSPFGNLTLTPNGKFYGMTYGGGGNSNDQGLIFEFDPISGSIVKKFDFNYSQGSNPQGSLTLASDGKLYGLTSFGGANSHGVIFEFNPTDGSYLKRFDFNQPLSGAYPYGNLTQTSNGKLYGTTTSGGSNNAGVLFEFDPLNGNFTNKFDFLRQTSGANPYGTMLLAPNKKLYGTTNLGGSSGQGVFFEFDPLTNNFTKKLDFTGTNGAMPEYSSLIFIKDNQVITFNTLPSKTVGDDPFTLIASASSGLPITYTSSDPTVALVNGSLVTILKAGSTIITASQPGNESYQPTTNVVQTLTVKSAQIITFNPIGNKNIGDPSFNVSATSNVGLPVTFSTLSDKITITGTLITLLKSGRSSITASQTGDISYGTASTDQSFCINPTKPNIIITSNNTPSPTLTSSSLSGNQWYLNDTAINEATSQTLNVTQSGVYKVQSKEDDCASAFSENQNVIVKAKENQVILFNSIPSKIFKDTPFNLAASSSSSLPITYTSSDPTVASVTETTVVILKAGATVITASQPGNEFYLPAENISQTFTVIKNTPSIIFNSISDKTLGDPSFNISATVSSGLSITFSSTSDKVTLTGAEVALVKSGRATINALQAEDLNYNATISSQSFCINPNKPQITVSGVNTSSPILNSNVSSGNQWYKNGVAISGATNSSLSVTESGLYKVQAKTDDCVSEFSTDQNLIITGDIKINSNFNYVEIYPNPVSDWLNISFDNLSDKKEVSIYELNGRKKYSQDVFESELRFNIHDYSQGVYLVKVITKNSVITKRFIKK